MGNAKPTQMVRYNVQYMRVDPQLRVSMIRAWNAPVLWPLVLVVWGLAALVWLVRRHLAGRAARNALGRDREE